LKTHPFAPDGTSRATIVRAMNTRAPPVAIALWLSASICLALALLALDG
jgi:hypothetical protein